jgi:agmatine deiminase
LEKRLIMPGEFESHEATWLVWPRNKLTFGKNIIEKVEMIYAEIIKEITRSEKVELVVYDDEEMDRVKPLISVKGLHFNMIKSCDVWVRDYGPIFVHSGSNVVAVKWRFNAWGGKYEDLMKDNITGLEIATRASAFVLKPRIVVEGGAIDVNGKGICLSTKSCLLDKRRNANISESKILSYLRKYLGIRNIIWLESRIPGDDTDGHVDNIARFVDQNKVVCVYSESKGWEFTRYNLKRLKELEGKDDGVEVYTLPVPEERPNLPLSYANFYITNNSIILPVFSRKNDDIAISTIESVSGKKVVPVECNALLNGFGGIHCITQQQPSPRRN